MTSPHAIITGGSSGIGKAIALQLAQQGAHISIIARDPERLHQAKGELEQVCPHPHQRVLALSCDVSDRQQVDPVMEEAIATLGPPHYLITCAGIAYPDHFQDIPIDIFERTMAVNYFGTLYCIRAALPSMEQQGSGQIAMISSAVGLIGLYGYSAYSPSKFALRGLAESLRGELKPLGIGVSIVYPTDTDTPQLAQENKTKPAATKEIADTANLWQPEDVARVVVRGLRRHQFEITPGLEMTLFNRLHSLVSPLLNRYFDGIIARHPRNPAP